LDISKDYELGGTISNANVFNKAKMSGAETDEGFEAEMEVPQGTRALVHSHPRGRGYSAAVGYKDNRALNVNFPNYITRFGKISVLELVDGQYQFRTIAGRLSDDEKRDSQARLNAFQTASRGQKCGCQE
jgi:hypothetical protein